MKSKKKRKNDFLSFLTYDLIKSDIIFKDVMVFQKFKKIF